MLGAGLAWRMRGRGQGRMAGQGRGVQDAEGELDGGQNTNTHTAQWLLKWWASVRVMYMWGRRVKHTKDAMINTTVLLSGELDDLPLPHPILRHVQRQTFYIALDRVFACVVRFVYTINRGLAKV